MDPLVDSFWDAVVVGTGMGGAASGYVLAKGGLRVLFLEKGLSRDESGTRGSRGAAPRHAGRFLKTPTSTYRPRPRKIGRTRH